MRARNLKPEFFRDRLIGSLAPEVRSVYQALWVNADDYGTVPLDAEQLKGDLFLRWPEITVEGIRRAFALLQGHRRITVHRVPNGDLFAIIVNWGKHQRPNRPGKYRHPTEGEPVTLEAGGGDRAGALPEETKPVPGAPPPPKPAKLEQSRFPKETCDALYEQWVKLVGAVDYGRFRKELLPAKPELKAGLEAIRLFALNRDAMDTRDRGFQTIAKFALDIAYWMRVAAQPLIEEDGTLTERGKLVSG